MLFGSNRDFNLLVNINRELLKDIVEQEVLYYKLSGPDLNREASFAFLREDLVDVNTVPEVGDIVVWNEDYYEVDTVRENQLFVGRDSSYNLTNYGSQFGPSLSIIVDCHQTRRERTGIMSTTSEF